MFVTNEYSRLYGIDCDDVVLLPNQPFEAFKGEYKVGAYARILDEDGKDIMKLQAGDIIEGIGIVPKLKIKPMTATKLKQLQETYDEKLKKAFETSVPNQRKKRG